MVCVPCIVIPAVLWLLHRFIYPLLLFIFPWLKTRLPFVNQDSVEDIKMTDEEGEEQKPDIPTNTVDCNMHKGDGKLKSG
ncbi:hypothetical protein EG68_06476 [Paragonimus skrjabini miyazakii]|uniref:Uncharacterized protein n=1 Tax=Paragonimus skrjabini miyazakii TaxID=59628 RepID=A0A8S9YZJ8_9TREM|nr:hypothetical protein EG68_06476 [Paragonimus skrjabini miyazakii]